MTDSDRILSLFDKGSTPAAIASTLACSLSKVYGVLREHRPQRQRAPRASTSELVPKIRGLLARGHGPARVAELCGVSRQYVYRIQGET